MSTLFRSLKKTYLLAPPLVSPKISTLFR